MISGSRTSGLVRFWRTVQARGLAFMAGACLCALVACFPEPQAVVLNPDTGNPVVLSDIDPILDDTSLTEAEKRQELLDLGLPESLVDDLLRAS